MRISIVSIIPRQHSFQIQETGVAMQSSRCPRLSGHFDVAFRSQARAVLVLALLAGAVTPQIHADDVRDAQNSPDANSAASSASPSKPSERQQVARTEIAAKGAMVLDSRLASPLEQSLQTARASRDTIRNIHGYTCTFRKHEQLKKGAALTNQTMSLKLRREPFSVYLKFVEPNPGRQVLYVDGRNDGKFYFKEPSGFLSYMGTMSIHPTSRDAMKESRHPVTMVGMEKMLDKLIQEWETSATFAETQVTFEPQVKLGSLDCVLCEVVHPQQREPFKFYKCRLYIDKKTHYPVRGEQYAFPVKPGKPPQLVEQYEYLDVKIVDKPADIDFDVKNPAYDFK
jgi:hypothetical protein